MFSPVSPIYAPGHSLQGISYPTAAFFWPSADLRYVRICEDLCESLRMFEDRLGCVRIFDNV